MRCVEKKQFGLSPVSCSGPSFVKAIGNGCDHRVALGVARGSLRVGAAAVATFGITST